jgi:hypothetical protein
MPRQKNPHVLAMSDKSFAICNCVPFKTLAEAEEISPNFSRSCYAFAADRFGKLLVRNGERNDGVFRTII